VRLGVATLLLVVVLAGSGHATSSPVTAVFAHPSYTPGAFARLNVTADATSLSVQALAALPQRGREPTALNAPHTIPWRPGSGTVWTRIDPNWPSGVYFFRVRTARSEAYAPVVVRPVRLGENTVAVVVPTYTWQAYNTRDGGTWYQCPCIRTIDLDRPYDGTGVPAHFVAYEQGFLEWLTSRSVPVDFLSDQDLDRFTSGDQLRRLYRLVVFSGHEEYVTRDEYDLVERYRDLGGHLMFLSADNFFREVVVNGRWMTLIGRWRDLGRPEAALLGSQYIDWNQGRYKNRPYRVVGAEKLPWLFLGTRLRDGSPIRGSFGIEIDGLAPSSPPGTVVIAEIPHVFGTETAQMTYYGTAQGAEVFAAGSMNFGGSALLPDVSALLVNLWAHMAD
jgi:hypothetical protein